VAEAAEETHPGVDWEIARVAYETELDTSLDVIAARFGMTRATLSWRAERELWLRRETGRMVGRPQIINRMLRVLERQLLDLENDMTELRRAKTRSGEKEVALLGKLAGNLDKLMGLEKTANEGRSEKRQTRDMAVLRNKLARRIEQLKGE
jgi:hypothetical protein